MSNERRQASEAQERLARDIFPMHLSPGEYVGRYGGDEGCFGYERYRYADDRVDRWIQAVARILESPAMVAACRRRVQPDEN